MVLGLAGATQLLLVPGKSRGEEQPARMIGTLRAERILFLGNSLTYHGPKPDIKWAGNWGMAASSRDRDFVHLLAAAINSRTKGKLHLEPPSGKASSGIENILNIADILERGYADYQASRIKKQLQWKADLVIVQCGENVVAEGFRPGAFKKALQAMLDDLKASSNPHIFVTGNILNSNPKLDEIKRQVCAEDPTRRTFVDISAYRQSDQVNGLFGHLNDQGMKLIAETLLAAILQRASAQ